MAIPGFNEISNIPFLGIVFAPVLYSILIPFAITLWVANETVRAIVRTLLWLKYGPALTLVNDCHDAVFNYYQSSGNSRNVLVIGITEKTSLNLTKLAKNFENRVLLHEESAESGPQLLGTRRYRPYAKLEKILVTVLGYACWKNDTRFDVTKHFRLAEDKVYDENNLMQLLSALSNDMDEARPQWEWVFIPRYQDATGKEKTVQIFRYHHSYMDELSLQFLLKTLSTNENVTLVFNPTEAKPEAWKKLILYTNTIIYGPFVLALMIIRRFHVHWIPSRLRSHEGKLNFVTSEPISVETFEKIRAQTNSSITNTTSKAFITSMKKVIPQDRLLQTVRINEILAVLPFKNSNPQNRSSVFAYDVPTNEVQETQQDFCDAITKLRRDRLAAVASPQHLLSFYVLSYFSTLPSFLVKYAVAGVDSSVMLRNIPSFSKRMSLFESEIEELSIYPPVNSKAGIALASISYGGSLKLTLSANSSWLTQEELQRIIIEMPKVINAIAEKGYIPAELPQLPAPKITPIEPQVLEMEDEASLRESSVSSFVSSVDENEAPEAKLLNGENKADQEVQNINAGQEKENEETVPEGDNEANTKKGTSANPTAIKKASNGMQNGGSEKKRAQRSRNKTTGKARVENGQH